MPSRVETSSLAVDGMVAPADLSAALAKIASGQTLTQLESAQAFELIMSGAATDAQLGALLMGLRVRGETVDEIAGAARALRARAVPVQGA